MKMLLNFCICCFTFAYGQTNTSKIYNAATLRKGFYMSYEEYLNNSPSIVYDFTVQYKARNKNDSSIISADYTLVNESENTGSVWGFCDGKDVFIKFTAGIFNTKFYRAEHIGIMPYFHFIYKGAGFGPGLIRLATLTAAVVSDGDLYLIVVDENDKKHTVKERVMRKLLANYPELFKNFNDIIQASEKDKNVVFTDKARNEIYKSYLIKLDKKKQEAK